MNILDNLRTPTNKVGFMLQLGYFKANGKFYTADQFRQKDIQYIVQILGLDSNDVTLTMYQKKIPIDHRKKILSFLAWKGLDTMQQNQLAEHINEHTKNQLTSKQLFLLAIDYCWNNKIEVPSTNQLTLIITKAYNQYESRQLNKLGKILTYDDKAHLLSLVETSGEQKPRMIRPPITLLKSINQSLRPLDIQENVNSFEIIKQYFYQFQSTIEQLELTDQATEYFSTWVQKAETFQLSSFASKNKLFFHLLAYIKHQFYLRQDILVDIFLKSVQATINAANKQLTTRENTTRSERNKAIRKVATSNKDSRQLIESITEIIKSSLLSETGKITKIEELVDEYHNVHDINEKERIIELEKSLDSITKNQCFFDALESLSIKLQRRVSKIAKTLDFDRETSDPELLSAIDYLKSANEIGTDAPINFLETYEKEVIIENGKTRISLYKVLLFIHMMNAIKSGKLNIRRSYRYRAIQDYLISKEIWLKEKAKLLNDSGLSMYSNLAEVMSEFKKKLDGKYQQVNECFIQGNNHSLSIENGVVKVNTPKIENDDTEYISALLEQTGYVPILQVLSDVNHITTFTKCFRHFSIKNKKMRLQPQTIFAGVIGKGCNIGINRIANISIGVTEDILKNAVTWCFSLKNIQAANNKIISIINKLSLADSYRRNKNQLHTGSDGRKVNVTVDSLHANYSYKYFGKGKGVTMYTFLDERHVLFHSSVISSSEREAAYVIDGLMQNEVIKSDIHSTDTHGFTETVFAATHLIGTAFAPRFKKIGSQNIYSFASPKMYENRGYQILPSRPINQKLILEHWDEILRFMATIKLRHTTASQLFKRLSSYAKDHPLYQALKEFGRIIKSLFILSYYDDIELRQRIEKQLNMVELSNKFSKAIFFSNNQEFKEGTKDEQEIATACMVLIQNAIILWNYLYLSQLIANTADVEQRNKIISLIRKGSVITWQHINLHGEYDFTKGANNSTPFDMGKILALEIA
jgi:TnpA family transposase